MKIKVYGQPNKSAKVRVLNPVSHQKIIRRLFTFDKDGVAIVDTDKLKARHVKELLKRYKYEEIVLLEAEETPVGAVDEIPIEADEPVKMYACKHCGMEFDAPYKLAQHVRKEHPKNKGET